jgi:Arc/MetJ family transcription regulator
MFLRTCAGSFVGHDSEVIERIYFRPDDEVIAEAMEKLALP